MAQSRMTLGIGAMGLAAGLSAGLILGLAAPSFGEDERDSVIEQCQEAASEARGFIQRSAQVYGAYLDLERYPSWSAKAQDAEKVTNELSHTVSGDPRVEVRQELYDCANSD